MANKGGELREGRGHGFIGEVEAAPLEPDVAVGGGGGGEGGRSGTCGGNNDRVYTHRLFTRLTSTLRISDPSQLDVFQQQQQPDCSCFYGRRPRPLATRSCLRLVIDTRLRV